jgi:hypothetical protein
MNFHSGNFCMSISGNDGLAIGTRTGLLAPRMALCRCIRAYITRSTIDAAPMSETQRRNQFPTSPFCTVTWYLQGQAVLVREGDRDVHVPLPNPVSFGGPRTEPVVSYNPGKVELFMMVLLPEALHALTGIDMSSYANCATAFDAIFDARWQVMARAVQAAPDHARRIELIEAFIEPLWMTARTHDGLRSDWLRGYTEGMAVQFLASQWGRSLRQLERQVKTWTGLPLQRWLGMRRAELPRHARRDRIRRFLDRYCLGDGLRRPAAFLSRDAQGHRLRTEGTEAACDA